jgi:hypothetical protein
MDNDGTANDDDTTPAGGANDSSGGTGGTQNQGSDQNTGDTNQGSDTNSGPAGQSDYGTGIVVIAEENGDFILEITAGNRNVFVTSEIIDLNDVREKIRENDIDINNFVITDFSITPKQSSMEFISANESVRYVMRVSFQEVGKSNTREQALTTPPGPPSPFPIEQIGNVEDGLYLNSQLFAVQPGFGEFTDMVKDESKEKVEIVVEIEFLDPLEKAGTLELEFHVEGSGKKATE